MRKLLKDSNADINIILTAVVLAIALAISVVIVFNVIGAFSDGLSTLDEDVASAAGRNTTSDTSATNVTNDLLGNVETFYTVAPIMLIVVAAVGILAYVLILRRE